MRQVESTAGSSLQFSSSQPLLAENTALSSLKLYAIVQLLGHTTMDHGASVLPTVHNATLEDVEKTIKQLSEKQRERVLLALRAAEPAIEESPKEQISWV